MGLTERNETSCQLSTISGQQRSANRVYISDMSQNQVQLWSAGASQTNQTLAGVSPDDLDGPTAIQFG